jgi:hypothetical protein
MPAHLSVTFSESYDLDRKIEDFLAQRLSAVAAGSPRAADPVQVDFVGLEETDRRVVRLRNAASQLKLRVRFC